MGWPVDIIERLDLYGCAGMKVTLTNLKGIKRLEFDIPKSGVWVITGLNGSGKTSLFASIYRISSATAFQKYFKNNASLDTVDSFSDSQITYEVDGNSVTYQYGAGRQKWTPTPRSQSHLLKQFPFTSVSFIEANSSRIEPHAYEVKGVKLNLAKKPIRDFMVEVLGDNKWDKLSYVHTRRGQGSTAYLIPFKSGQGTTYYTEKNFSLGELCVLNLAKKLSSAKSKDLILIDEVEIALHPLAQVRLLQLVSKLASDHKLTVLFSTHSAALIKNIGRSKLIFLKPRGEGTIDVVKDAYPAEILGEIAFSDELGFDRLMYVEDKNAKLLLELMCALFIHHSNPGPTGQPLFRVVPVGGFIQVIEMLKASPMIFPSHIKRFAFLDLDVKTESLQHYKQQNDRKALELFESVKNNLSYLPCTPEVGVIEMLEASLNSQDGILKDLETSFSGHIVKISLLLNSKDYKILAPSSVRDRAKKRLNFLVGAICEKTGVDEMHVKRVLFNKYVNSHYSDISKLKSLLGPVFG